MKHIFKLLADAENYRMVVPGMGVEAWMALGRQMLDFEPAGDRWKPGLFRWHNLSVPCGTFFSTGDRAMIGVTYDAKRSRSLWNELEKCGELLPIQIEEYGEAFAWRILNTSDVIDWSRSRFQTLANGNRVVTKAVLRQESFVEGGFLRSGEMPLSPLYFRDESTSFFREYTRCNMTGLIFEGM